MTAILGPADVSILYDTARGFIGLKTPAEILRHALLSIMGTSGTRLVLYLERAPGNRLVLRAVRGAPVDGDLSFRMTAGVEQHLDVDPGPHRVSQVEWLDARTRARLQRDGIVLIAAVARKGKVGGLLAVGPKLLGEPFTHQDESLIGAIAGMTGLAILPDEPPFPTSRRRAERVASASALRSEHPALRTIRGDGEATRSLLEEIVLLREFDHPVLLVGETGTGKELVARALHDLGPRASEPFEAINCAAIPPELMPSALFGHERGAFTGALSTARGAFERAGGGTLFLDEIGDMPFATQATLLRVLQEKRFRRVGGETLIPARARIISATNRDLPQAVKAGSFRADLFYRIQMAGIRIPPLRDRKDEIPCLVEHLLAQQRPGKRIKATAEFLAALARRPLAGNVRELEGLVLTALLRAGREGILRGEHLPPAAPEIPTSPPRGSAGPTLSDSMPSYRDMEREYIQSVLRLFGGNKKQSAALMGIPRTTLNARIRKLDLDGKV